MILSYKLFMKFSVVRNSFQTFPDS